MLCLGVVSHHRCRYPFLLIQEHWQRIGQDKYDEIDGSKRWTHGAAAEMARSAKKYRAKAPVFMLVELVLKKFTGVTGTLGL